MTRRKGERTAAHYERESSFFAIIPIPVGGFGYGVEDIGRLHRSLGLPERQCRGMRFEDRNYLVLGFDEEMPARRIADAFGGEVCSTQELVARRRA